MKKKIIRYGCYCTLTTSILIATLASVACSNDAEIPKMTVSYGPEIGFANGNVDLSGETPVINISDIKAEVGMNIDYLSGVSVANEADFPDLEIWVDASSVDIFTAGNYTVEYTFVYGSNTISKSITVTLVETEQSASDTAPTSSTKVVEGGNSDKNTSEATTKNNNNKVTTSSNNTTQQPTTSNSATTAPTQTTTKPSQTSNTATTKPTQTSNTATTKPNQTTNSSATTKPTQTTSQKPTTTRQIITTTGNHTTELKNLGNYTIELLSGDTITIKNTTSRYIVSTRTDIEIVEEKGCTYRISKLIITYNTGFEHVLETVKDRIK